MPVFRALARRARLLQSLPVLSIAPIIALSGCAMSSRTAPVRPPLPHYFACLRQQGAAVVSAHRGAPDAAHAENTLAAYAALAGKGLTLAETDVRPSRDGVLVLSHDPALERTSSLAGRIADQDWATIRMARMRTRSGTLTDAAPATLPELLAATRTGPVLQLDIKQDTPIAAVLDAVEAAQAQDRVIYLAYSDGDIAAIVRRQPGAVIATVIPDRATLARLEGLGVAPDHLHALFFLSAIDRPWFAALKQRGVTVLVAATQAEETGPHDSHPLDAARYRAIRDAGAQILVSDHPTVAAAALAGQRC